MKKYIGLILILFGCNSEDANDGAFEEKPFESETIFVTGTYPEFESEVVPKTLEELGLCTTVDSLIGKPKSICSSNLFRVFPLDTNANFGDGFILDTRIGALAETPSKALLVFVKIGDRLQLMNFLKGKILEFRTTQQAHRNIVMSYRDSRVAGNVNILHQWNPGKKAYLPVEVLEINNHFVKEEYKDSLNEAYLTEFAWGY